MQPFPTYQNFGYQPQYGGYQQYNPLQPQYDRLAQMQTQYNQQQLYNQPVQQAQTPGLNGEIVDGLDVVKAKNVDMSGQPTFYPKSDLSEVYVKRLMQMEQVRLLHIRQFSRKMKSKRKINRMLIFRCLILCLDKLKQRYYRELAENYLRLNR